MNARKLFISLFAATSMAARLWRWPKMGRTGKHHRRRCCGRGGRQRLIGGDM